MIFGYPIEIWIGVIISVLVKIRYNSSLTLAGALLTMAISLGSGMILYQPVLEIFQLGMQWAPFIAMLIALTSDNIMKSILEISEDTKLLKGWATYFVTRERPNRTKSPDDDDDDDKNCKTKENKDE